MNRVANYTIKGFLYQFNMTLLNILESPENAVITVEGVIEDIDIETDDGIHAIQCKYHESNSSFVLSAIYEPILQMMVHYKNNPNLQIVYKLYAHFPREPVGKKVLDENELKTIINSNAKKYEKYTDKLKESFDLAQFRNKFELRITHSFDKTVRDVKSKFIQNGIDSDDIGELIYPNALTIIGDLSIQKDAASRKITRAELIDQLVSIRTIAISRWTVSLKNYDKLLKERRKQLKSNLDKNARRRHILLSQDLENFSEEIVIFIQDYLQKFHFKPSHIYTPLFCLDCDNELFKDIRKRIIRKQHKINDGFLVNEFNIDHLLREPVVNPSKKLTEFDLRITTLEIAPDILQKTVCEDLYLVDPKDKHLANPLDVKVERLAVRNFKELRFIFGMEKSYE